MRVNVRSSIGAYYVEESLNITRQKAMNPNSETLKSYALGGRTATHPKLTKYVQSRQPGIDGGRVTRPTMRERRRAAERFHKKQAKKER